MRIVITGGPSVGKTTIVSLMEQRGYKVVHEVATQIIKEGRFLPWVDRKKFQSEVLKRQLAVESSILDFENPIFLDRGAFDGEAYYLVDSLPVPPQFSMIDSSQYDLAFLVEELPFFDKNEVRREDLEFSKRISVMLEECYAKRNIKVIRVPAMPPDERVDFVIKNMREHMQKLVRSPEQAVSMFRTMSPLTVSAPMMGTTIPV